MRRILTVNIMILLIFASASYWMEEGEKLKDTMASAETIQAEVSEPEVEKKYIKGVDFQVSCLALSESYEYDRDTYGTEPSYQLDRSVGLDSGTYRRKLFG